MKITTPNKTEVELKDYITGREDREIQAVVQSGMKITNNEIQGFDTTAINKSQDKAIEIVVKSVNGKTENIVDAILDLPKKDSDFVIAKVDEITKGGNTEKKTK